MSDYFAALWRASGLGQQSPAVTPADSSLNVLDLEIPAAAMPASSPSLPLPRHREAAPNVAMATLATPVVAPPSVPQSASVAHTPAPALAPPTPANIEPAAATLAAEKTEPVLAHQALVQSVMRWVAGEPAAPTAAQPTPGVASLSVAAQGAQPVALNSHPQAAAHPITAAVSEPAENPLQRPRTPPQSMADAALIAPTLTQPTTPLPQPAATLRTPAETEAQEAAATEGLSISIGAIHLRVEAPVAPSQAQAAAKPAAPPAARSASSTPAPAPTTRSSLSRRALRRI